MITNPFQKMIDLESQILKETAILEKIREKFSTSVRHVTLNKYIYLSLFTGCVFLSSLLLVVVLV
ncbi:MAG: hypothetical protein PHG66_00870 [Candidatus Colwellbacteria bacterium]|nr:hypothetical protein [Candidatus Colwellbacteria bacterium]